MNDGMRVGFVGATSIDLVDREDDCECGSQDGSLLMHKMVVGNSMVVPDVKNCRKHALLEISSSLITSIVASSCRVLVVLHSSKY